MGRSESCSRSSDLMRGMIPARRPLDTHRNSHRITAMIAGEESAEIDRRFALYSAAIFVVLTSAFFVNVLLAGRERMVSGPGGDLTMQFLPFRSFGFDELARGEIPQWNPYTFSGTPYAADFQ